MKKLFTSVLLLISVLLTYSQQKNSAPNKGVAKTEILKGSVQKLSTECGYGNTSIKQTVITHVFSKSKKPYYTVKTILWLQYKEQSDYDCYGAWGYDMLEIEKLAFGKVSLIQEKEQQAKKAFELLKYLLQNEGKL